LGNHRAQDLYRPLALRALARAPGRLVGPSVRQLVLQPGHLGRVAIGVELGHDLMSEDVPVVRGANGRARALRRPPLPPLDDRVLELPLVGSDLLLGPVACVVAPLVTATDLHAGVALAFMLLELVVRRSRHAVNLGMTSHGSLFLPRLPA